MTFFMLQGLGALAGTGVLRRRRRRVPRGLAIALTLAFVVATTPVFLWCLDPALARIHADGWGASLLQLWRG